jgi:hypothetical protein
MAIAHAKLSASGSSRWLNCPGSVKAEEPYSDQSSDSFFAREGSCAHEVADICLKSQNNADYQIGFEHFGVPVDKEMTDYVQEYLDYVRSFETKNTRLWAEERVCFNHVVPEGFGTCDAAVLDFNTKTLNIFDLKYGQGEAVFAENNSQGQLYALGFLNELDFLDDDIETIVIHICQPRKGMFTEWAITKADLLAFGEWVKERAALALSGDAERVPGEKQCRWCKAKDSCRALMGFTQKVLASDFDNLDAMPDPNVITDDEKRLILHSRKIIENFLKAVEESVFERLNKGDDFEGYKLVEGRSVRQWNDAAEDYLVSQLGDNAYNKKLIGITAAEKELGKGSLNDFTYKPAGKPTLALETDKRPAIDVKNDFDIIK